MTSETLELDRLRIVGSLCEVPFLAKSKDEAVKRITVLAREALGSHTCSLAIVDLDNKTLTQIACTSAEAELEEFLTGRPLRVGSSKEGANVDLEILERGLPIERYGLQEDGQGVANPDIAKKYGFRSLLSYPLRSDGELIAYLNHFSSQAGPFRDDERQLMEIFAHQATLTIERFNHLQTLNKSLSILSDLSRGLLSISPRDFPRLVAEKACELLSVPICIVWRLDERTRRRLYVVATSGEVDDGYRRLTLDAGDRRVRAHLESTQVSYLSDAAAFPGIVHRGQIERRGWVSLLSAPLRVEERVIGLLDVFTKKRRSFKTWEKESFETFANHVALSFQRARLLKEAEARKKLEKLTEAILEMTEAHTVNDLLRLFLRGGLDLVGSRRGLIRLLNYETGFLDIVEPTDNLPKDLKLQLGEGITGLALKKERPLRVGDVRAPRWREVFAALWEDTRSELAIPILVKNAPIMQVREVKSGSKPIGVLNIESTSVNAFRQIDEDCLWSLSRYAAVMIERLESDRRHSELAQIEKEMAAALDYDQTIDVLLKGITQVLRFGYVNISLVVPDSNCIRTEHVFGISEESVEKFKGMAVHSLDSNDIQADIVRTREIEVPDINDERLDERIAKEFRHERLARVFIPMIESTSNRVIGTVEAGYANRYRKHIYERDVQILKRLVDSAAQALQRRKSGLLDKVSHEFRAPIVGIRSNASFLQTRRAHLEPEIINKKLDDILTDCAILLYEVAELEFILGRPRKQSKFERTLVFRDIIKKTINQLKPIVAERGFEPSKIEYNPAYSRILVVTDIAKLNQVVYNLLINSIKYAEADPRAFTIRIELEENREFTILKFKDWGIGIKKQYEDRIFDEGFRTPEAEAIDVTGSGLGLALSKIIMEEQLGGDLVLAKLYKPTEFHICIPKRPKEESDDSIRRR